MQPIATDWVSWVLGVEVSDEDIADFEVLRNVAWQPFFGFLYMAAHSCHLVNPTEPSVCCGDAALLPASCNIARSTSVPVFNWLRGRFWGFSPRRGDMLHGWGWNLAWMRGPLHAKFHQHRCNDKGVGPPKLKFLLRFDRNVEYKCPAGAYLLRDFYEICVRC